MRVFPALLFGLLTLGLATAHAEVPSWCATVGAEVRANTPSCQEPTGESKICRDLGAEAQRLFVDWKHGDAYLRDARYGRTTTVRSAWGSQVRDQSEAAALVQRAEARYPALLDAMVQRDCRDDIPVGVQHGWSNDVLLGMVNKGALTWEKWATWANQ